MIKNKETGKLIDIYAVDTTNNHAYCYEKNDYYAVGNVVSLHVANLQNFLNDNTLQKTSGSVKSDLINCAKLALIESGNYEPFQNIWKYTDWAYRIYVTDAQIRTFNINYPELIAGLYEQPVNPKEAYSDGVVIYLNTILPEAALIFEQLNITIETIH